MARGLDLSAVAFRACQRDIAIDRAVFVRSAAAADDVRSPQKLIEEVVLLIERHVEHCGPPSNLAWAAVRHAVALGERFPAAEELQARTDGERTSIRCWR